MKPPMEKPTTENEGNQRSGHAAPGNETHRHANTDEKRKPRNAKAPIGKRNTNGEGKNGKRRQPRNHRKAKDKKKQTEHISPQ